MHHLRHSFCFSLGHITYIQTIFIYMDPPTTSINGNGIVQPPRGVDPPEELEMSSLYRDDTYLDQFELEGLVSPTTSNVGTKRSVLPSYSSHPHPLSPRRIIPTNNDIYQYIHKHTSQILTLCSIAWQPKYRSKSTIALLFIAFTCMIIFTENDVIAWHESFFSKTYTRRNGGSKNDPLAKLTTDQRTTLLKQIYGSWTFFDGSAEDRPTTPYLTVENGNIYLDLPEDKFPLESWQADAVYANHFLDAAEKLCKRGQQAIFTTYHGYGLSNVHTVKNNNDDGEENSVEYIMEDVDKRSSLRRQMFHIEEIDLDIIKTSKELYEKVPKWDKMGGWTTQRSFDGLERRIKHAIMTKSNFTVVITGNWQSMGYGGNHAFQSMGGVFETLLRGMFDKLGINLVVTSIGLPPLEDISLDEQMELQEGGRSTLLHTLGWSSIYGSDVDMVVWDDYSPIHDDGGEKSHDLDELSKQIFDLFARQALLSGTTNVPFLWGGDFEVLRNLHNHADVDVGQLGNGLAGVPESTSQKIVSDLPWAAQYLNCPTNMHKECEKEEHQFESKCWIDRSDVTPSTSQLDHIPILPTATGWRMQQLKGYTLAYVLITATLDALLEFSEVTISQGFPLADEHWHMGEYIKNIQYKVKSLDESAAPHCFQIQEKLSLPKRLCRHRMSGRTEYTPRANPKETSIRSILHLDHDIATPQIVYEGDDVENPIRLPNGEVDAVELLDLEGKRRRLSRSANGDVMMATHNSTTRVVDNVQSRRNERRTEEISPGKGWQLKHSYGDDCDGSFSSSTSCGRISSNNCLLEGHQGSRGGIWGNESTGWLVLQSITTENGYIAMNLEIGGQHLPESFTFEYAIDGTITKLDKSQLVEKLIQPVPGVSLLTVYDDEKSTEEKDIAVSIRVAGCSNDSEDCQFALTHVYWS